jgi:hypothetical protein
MNLEVVIKYYLMERGMSEEEQLPKPILIEDLDMLYPTESSKQKRRFGLYKCGFCGEEFRTQIRYINNGMTKSCGCYRTKKVKERRITHNLTNTKIYNIWTGIKRRTLNPKDKAYSNYGGRGIKVCEEWLDIQNFYNWAMSNGYEENKGLSIDRIDNDGGYSPENCRWTTITIQNRNRRIPKNNISGFKGVSYRKDENKYIAYISVKPKRIHLGSFSTPEEGAIAYNNYIIENNLEGFNLNVINIAD